ncbi:MAG TPA: hypothetical protein VLB79_10955 [Solirubrobacterales bacterium]|nr:hypothetical protein [Solirubrobacterales bacterium]
MVHDPAQAIASIGRGLRTRRVAGTLSALAAGALIAGCGGGPNTQPQVDVGPNVGQPINLADCNDWEQANIEQRLGTIHQIRDFAGGPVVGNNASSPSGTGAVLDDKDAYDLFNGWCSKSFARGFKLYHLYQRAAAFTRQPAQ